MRLKAPGGIEALPSPQALPVSGSRPGLRSRLAVAALAAGLLGGAFFLPIWETRLEAPQYPGGLRMIAYGDRVTGDVEEINSLNHYIGMRPLDTADVPEMRLWLPSLVVAVVAVVIATVAGRQLWGRLARLYLWLMPVAVLATIQFRLYQYGHDLDPKAALRLDPFTPWAVGPTQVWNFAAWARPGGALLCILAAAAVLSFGPRLVSTLGRKIGTAAALVMLMTLPLPTAAANTAVDLGSLIADAAPGQTLVVPEGTHHGSFVLDRPIVLDGRGRATLHGHGRGTVLRVTAAGAVIRGLRITGSGAGPTGDPAAIRVEADDVTVENVRIDDVYTGIAVAGSARARVVDNVIQGRPAPFGGEGHALGRKDHQRGEGLRGDGISLWNADQVLIRGNRVHGARDGVYLSFGSDALVDGNTVSESRYGVHSMYARSFVLATNELEGNASGAVLMYGGPVLVLSNRIQENRSPATGFGLLLKDVEAVEAVRNVVVANRVGMHIEGSPTGEPADTRVSSNTIARNDTGVALLPTARATFSVNSFVDNTIQVLPKGRGVAGKSHWMHRGVGNYWSNYRGIDRTGEGVGDLPHHEATTVPSLVATNPLLSAFATSPGFRIAAATWDRWVAHDPVVTDRRPLMSPHSPALTEPFQTSGVDLPLAVGGVLVAIGSALILARLRRTSEPEEWRRADAQV